MSKPDRQDHKTWIIFEVPNLDDRELGDVIYCNMQMKKGSAMPRQSIYHTLSFKERCKALAGIKLKAAAALAPGPERDSLTREAKELENATKIERWLHSAELRPPV